MKIQSLAVMFIILILPISLVLASYTQNRVETLSLQSRYDSKLNDATYDALKAYQINSLNSDTSDLTNSRMRNIKASVNTFFNTMSTNFSTLGYTKETIQNYVPALVFTMYDGYYIYSPYTNTWDDETKRTVEKQKESYKEQGIDYTPTYTDGENLYGLKPYVYYSCRYTGTYNNGYDVVITYSLDNYIQIQGTVNGGKVVSKYGYLLSEVDVENDDTVYYKGIEIKSEDSLTETIVIDGQERTLTYIKKNGTKYYYDDNNDRVISVLNGKASTQSHDILEEINTNNNAKNYYKEAYNLQQFIKTYLGDLGTKNIADDKASYYQVNGQIFDFENGIESETSNFNTHRIEVIKHAIEKNLSIAIENFNKYSGVTTDFKMPKLKDTDWDKIMDNISIISFLQGINIGGKVYNGYSIITNNKNEDIVMEDSIYIKTSDGTFHRVTEDRFSKCKSSNRSI